MTELVGNTWASVLKADMEKMLSVITPITGSGTLSNDISPDSVKDYDGTEFTPPLFHEPDPQVPVHIA